MTKVYIFLTVAVILVLSVSIGSLLYLRWSAAELVQNFSQIERALDSNNWQDAQAYIDSSHQKWDRYRRLWPLLIDHTKITEIARQYITVEAAINEQDQATAHLELSQLAFLIHKIPEEESLSWQNIF